MRQLILGKMRNIYTERKENERMYINTSMTEGIQTEGNILKEKQQKQR